MAGKENPNAKVVADNRRARFDYELGEDFEAGIMLTGTEVKSLRTGKATVAESYAAVERNGEMMLLQRQYPRISPGEPLQPRAEALAQTAVARQGDRASLAKGVEREGMTIVPLRIYFNDKGRAKIAIALGRGKKLHDKRETEKVRDWKRDKSRLMRERG